MIPVTTFAGRRVAVFGLGASGNATALALLAGGAEVAAWDDNAGGRDGAARAGVPLVDLADADWSGFAALVLAPGVPLTHPEPHWTVRKAAVAGIEVIGDIELFLRERAAHCPAAPVVAVTGTNGKSTTTALIAHILRRAGLDVQMGGNIGRAVLTLEPPAPDRVHVIETSSFQIDLTTDRFLRPTVAVLTNLTPDHLDRHGPPGDAPLAMRNYAAVKERLVTGADMACIGAGDDLCRAIAARRRAAGGATISFAVDAGPAEHCGIVDGRLACRDHEKDWVAIADLAGIPTLRGRHNAENALAAFAAAGEAMVRAGHPAGPDLDWQGALATYPGLPHRMEEVGTLEAAAGRILFINDSKATNADSTDKALAAFERDIHWILGGKPKEGGITTLERWFPRIARAYLIGQASDAFAATLDGRVPYVRAGTLDAALRQATADAATGGNAEPVVLLSPACASYDQFRSFEHRGDVFRQLVQAMPGVRKGGA